MKRTIIYTILLMILMTSVSAFSILSADKIDFNSNNPDLAKPAFVITAVENGGAQFVEYSLSNLAQSLPDGYEMTGSGTIKSTISNYRITYPTEIIQSIYNIENIGNDWFLLGKNSNSAQDWCKMLAGGDNFVTARNTFQSNVRCLKFVEIGKLADIKPGTHRFTETVSVSVAGKGVDYIILTESNRVDEKRIGPSNHIVARIEGAISDFTDVPRPDLNYNAFYDESKWNVMRELTTSEALKLTVDGERNNFIACDQNNNWEVCFSSIQINVVDVTKKVEISGATMTGSEEVNGQVEIIPTQIYKYPLITLIIDADWVGIFRPVGEPNIHSLSVESKLIEGDREYIDSEVSNDANVGASFAYSWSCSGPFQVASLGFQSFQPDETKQLRHLVTGQTSTGCSSGICTLTVKDRESPTSLDTKSVNLNICEANQCEAAGIQRCNIRTKQVCSEEGGVLVWKGSDTCPESCILENGFANCEEDKNIEPVCPDDSCHSKEYEVTLKNPDSQAQYYCPEDCKKIPRCSDGTLPPCGGGGNIPLIAVSSLGILGLLGAIGYRFKWGTK